VGASLTVGASAPSAPSAGCHGLPGIVTRWPYSGDRAAVCVHPPGWPTRYPGTSQCQHRPGRKV